MDGKIKEYIELINTKCGLENYFLKTSRIYRRVNLFNETVYTLATEWFPNHAPNYDEEELNPVGTASVEINFHTRKFESIIFVGGVSHAGGLTFGKGDRTQLIEWLESETNLTYGKHFQLAEEKRNRLVFKGMIDDTPFSPASGTIEIELDDKGKLVLFSVFGDFPTMALVEKETFSLDISDVMDIAKEQMTYLEFAGEKHAEKEIIPAYALTEIFIANDKSKTYPFEMIGDNNYYTEVNQLLDWDSPLPETFQAKPIEFLEELSIDEVLVREPHPNSLPLTQYEIDKSINGVIDFLRQVYPEESGKWLLQSLRRMNNYLIANLTNHTHKDRVFSKRKLKIFINNVTFNVENFMDNKDFFAEVGNLPRPTQERITREDALAKISHLLELKPYYVFDRVEKKFVLCGLLDCQYAVNAVTGEVLSLDDL